MIEHLTPTHFLSQLSRAQLLALTISELHQSRGDAPPTRTENWACAQFGILPAHSQVLALAWLKGAFGPGHHLDRR